RLKTICKVCKQRVKFFCWFLYEIQEKRGLPFGKPRYIIHRFFPVRQAFLSFPQHLDESITQVNLSFSISDLPRDQSSNSVSPSSSEQPLHELPMSST